MARQRRAVSEMAYPGPGRTEQVDVVRAVVKLAAIRAWPDIPDFMIDQLADVLTDEVKVYDLNAESYPELEPVFIEGIPLHPRELWVPTASLERWHEMLADVYAITEVSAARWLDEAVELPTSIEHELRCWRTERGGPEGARRHGVVEDVRRRRQMSRRMRQDGHSHWHDHLQEALGRVAHDHKHNHDEFHLHDLVHRLGEEVVSRNITQNYSHDSVKATDEQEGSRRPLVFHGSKRHIRSSIFIAPDAYGWVSTFCGIMVPESKALDGRVFDPDNRPDDVCLNCWGGRARLTITCVCGVTYPPGPSFKRHMRQCAEARAMVSDVLEGR